METVKRPVKSTNPLISTKCVELLNYRIEQEELSARLYLAMSMWLDNKGFINAAKLWKKYSDEEMTHSTWAREYLLAFGIQPNVPMLLAPVDSFSGFPQIINDTFDHEIQVTLQIKELATCALQEGDHMLYQLALSYLKEQVEEAAKTQNLKDALVTFGEDKIALRLLDNSLED
jgi:ferritin